MAKQTSGRSAGRGVVLSRRVFAAAGVGAAMWRSEAAAQAAGEAFDLASYRGKVVYLDFWASWCGPCQESFPYMNRLLAQLLPARDFVLRAVNVDHDKRRADAFLQRYGGQVPIIFDPRGLIAARFNIRAMPTSLVIDRTGRTRFTHSGFHPEDIEQYDSDIEQVLHEQ